MSKDMVYNQLRAGTLTPVEALIEAGITNDNKHDPNILADILLGFGDFRDDKSRFKLTKKQVGWIRAIAMLLKELGSEKSRKRDLLHEKEDDGELPMRETRGRKKRRHE